MPPRTNGDQPVTRVTLRPLGSTLPLAFGLTTVSGSVGETSRVLGVFFLCCAAVFLILVGGGIAGGRRLPAR